MNKKSIISDLQKALLDDSDYFNGWQANIAMSFIDEFRRVKGDDFIKYEELHLIANESAISFLNKLIK